MPLIKAQRSDKDILLAMRLEQRLQACMQLTVRVHVCENRLQLFGDVGSWHEKQHAQEIARELAPEYRICNQMRVTTG